MSDTLPALAAALVTGFLGSAHCLGMCAGISGLVAVDVQARTLHERLPLALVYNAGRVSSYTILGALVAGIGGGLVAALPALVMPVRLIGGLVIVLVGLQVAFGWRALQAIEGIGALLWKRIAPVAKSFLPVTSLPRALGLGLVWGWLPCGLVYSVLLIAATRAEALTGALIMLAFGLGTVPAMTLTGVGAGQLPALLGRAGIRRGAGLLIVILGALTLAVPLARLVR